MIEILSRKNPLIVHIKKLGADSDYRRSCCEFVCDGDKLLVEAIAAGADISAVLCSGDTPPSIPEQVPVYSVGQDIIETASPLKNPQGVIFSCRMKPTGECGSTEGCHIILEGIQDPGNVGTVIRTAAAFNIGSVILTGGCADPYNPKTIRASMGAIFRQRLIAMDFAEIVRLKAEGLRLYGASLGSNSLDLRQVSLKNCAVAIGSEGKGLSDALLDLCDERIRIPMAPSSESLNAAVAASVIMWEASKGD